MFSINVVLTEIFVFAGRLKREAQKIDFTRTGIIRFMSVYSVVFFISAHSLMAYTVVTLSTSTPESVETAFLANATNYINSVLTVNQFFPNTYTLELLSINPDYVPPSNVSIDTTTWFDTLAAVSSDTYTNGYANGLTAQVYNEIGVLNGFFNDCASTGTWFLPGTTNYVTLDSTTTCIQVLDTLSYSMYQILYSTGA